MDSVGLTIDHRAGAKILQEQIYIQSSTGENKF